MSVKGMLLPIVLVSVVILAGGAPPSSAARVPSDSLGPTLASAAPRAPSPGRPRLTEPLGGKNSEAGFASSSSHRPAFPRHPADTPTSVGASRCPQYQLYTNTIV